MTVALTFLAPERLWLLIAVGALAAVYVAMQFRRRRHVVAFTNIDLLDQLAPQRPGWRRHVVAALYLAAMVFGVIAIAQPAERTLQRTESSGRILLVFDVSLSMEATDVEPNRIEAAKEAALDFADRVDDNIELGLVSFSQDVAARVAPTLNHQRVRDAIEDLDLEPGTAIGDALAVAADIIGPPTEQHPDDPAGAIVLLSDGETTQGRPTAVGSAAAAENEIPVYAIAFGTDAGTVTNPDTGEVIAVPVGVDELTEVAETTGGQFFEAPTAEALQGAYDEISDNLNAGVGDPIEVIIEQTWKFAATALALIALAWLLGAVLLRGML